jgi:tRNA dimethylallyltransferase
VKHHFVGTHSITDYYSASMYEQDVLKLLGEGSGERLSLLTGGSMMYIDAVCNGIDDIPTIRDDIREEMKRRYEEEGLAALVEELRLLDPEHYEVVDRNNPRRVIHALEICHQTGKTYTSFRTNTKKERPFNIIKIALTRPREELYDRINHRVDKMVDNGLVEEARALYPLRHLNALNTVGYKELFRYFDGEWSLPEAIERIKGNTRQYCRKQLTWFKRDPQIRWFSPDDEEEIINTVFTILKKSSQRL